MLPRFAKPPSNPNPKSQQRVTDNESTNLNHSETEKDENVVLFPFDLILIPFSFLFQLGEKKKERLPY